MAWGVGGVIGACVLFAGCTTAPETDSSDSAPQATAAAPSNSGQLSVPNPSGNLAEYDNAVKVATCLWDQGWSVEVDGQGGWGVVSSVPVEQSDVYQAAYDQCVDDLAIGQGPVTAETAAATFENDLRVHECLESNGFPVGQVPLKEVFISQTLEQPEAPIWDPFELVANDPAQLTKAIDACPQ